MGRDPLTPPPPPSESRLASSCSGVEPIPCWAVFFCFPHLKKWTASLMNHWHTINTVIGCEQHQVKSNVWWRKLGGQEYSCTEKNIPGLVWYICQFCNSVQLRIRMCGINYSNSDLTKKMIWQFILPFWRISNVSLTKLISRQRTLYCMSVKWKHGCRHRPVHKTTFFVAVKFSFRRLFMCCLLASFQKSIHEDEDDEKSRTRWIYCRSGQALFINGLLVFKTLQLMESSRLPPGLLSILTRQDKCFSFITKLWKNLTHTREALVKCQAICLPAV